MKHLTPADLDELVRLLLREQAVTLSKQRYVVSITCDNDHDAQRILEWLEDMAHQHVKR